MNRKKLCLLSLVVSEAVEFVVDQISHGAVLLFEEVRAVHLTAGLVVIFNGAVGREVLLLFLIDVLKLAILGRQESKSGYSLT